MKALAALILNKVLSRIIFFGILFGGLALGVFLAKLLGLRGGRSDCLAMFCPAVLFAMYGWLRFTVTRTISVAAVIWSALFLTFGVIVLVKG
jgi:hypothetical protein